MNNHRTHLERLLLLIPAPYYLAGAIIGAIIFISTSIIIVWFENNLDYIWPCFVLSSLVALQSTVVFWAHKKIILFKDILVDIVELPKQMTLKWYENQELNIFNDKMMILVGVFLTILAHYIGLDNFGFSFKSTYSYFLFGLDYYFAHYIMGAGLYVWIATAWMLYQLSKLPLDINILLSKNIRFKGVLYSKFTICAIVVYLVWGVFHMSTPARLRSPQSMIWFSSFAMVLLGYFILPQYNIYKIIAKTKKEKLAIFSSSLRAKAEETFRNPTYENFTYLNKMLGVQAHIDEMSEWPFGSYEILHIVLIIIIPLMVLMLELVFKIIRES
jgi:hypothetical protein